MQTHPIEPLKGQMPTYRWLPVIYLLFFGGVLLICLWAEVNRRQQLPTVQPTCFGVGHNLPIQSAPKRTWFGAIKKPVFRLRDHIPAEKLTLYG
ncbi:MULTISPECIES: hypothetical protein [unclassified Spirosoma]|uniref:hypothetical protein n=1 Tax=unclassified Spirosoma TaxID=2621999 RepID=UPI00095C19CF|nr:MULTISPECIES: hypothetical protein [unclassified Spirosoma]MBN8820674.1 hypothetical protein [Spirosoma sp.]OJW77824.1 MAG: hypothetical protein BGO59_04455 [Spirosoma sp. 48-14]